MIDELIAKDINYEELIEQAIGDIKAAPIDLLQTGLEKDEFAYLGMLRDTYLRTIRDLDLLLKSPKRREKILEIGSLFGVVSKSLKKMGYSVFALDIPEFYESPALQSLYEKAEIPFVGVNLRHSVLPYESGFFDAVILCEVIEHFNFNPLPSLKEINRVLKPGGILYIGTPNMASIKNRIDLLRGRSIRNPVGEFFEQLDRKYNKIVSLHWREYTLSELVEMIERVGFEISQQYYFSETITSQTKISTRIKKKIAYSVPSFRPFQVVIARKTEECVLDFWKTDASG
jgi:SAM-dependent methyltransferase